MGIAYGRAALRAAVAAALRFAAAAALVAAAPACTPKVEVAPPKEPITINVNVKIEHEVRVKVDKDLENLFDEKEDLF